MAVLRFLTVEGCDKIQRCLELLIEDGQVEWRGSLKKTYDAYLHPDVLDYDSPEMWRMAADGEITSLFQMETDVGGDAIKKVRPTNLKELSLVNSAMRLMGDDNEQPIDRYVTFKNSPQLWYQEAREAGLNEDEIHVLEKHLKQNHFCSLEQETMMQLCMDEHIAGFDMIEANVIRKSVAKKVPALMEKSKKLFFEKGAQLGSRKLFLDYVWKRMILPQAGYAFASAHTLVYSCIALQEMNLYYHYPHIYWQCACLTVNAAADEESEGGNTNYGKVARAISSMQHQGVHIALPDINEARFGFRPDATKDEIYFGLKALHGVGDSDANQIIANRPYASLQDFLTRNTTSPYNLTTTTIIALIKGGCFDELEAPSPRQEIMQRYLLWQAEKDNPPKEALNMQNFKAILSLGILPKEYEFQQRLNEFRSYTFSKEKLLEKDTFILDNMSLIYFENVLCKFFDCQGDSYTYADKLIFSYTDDGDPIIYKKPFEKFYKAQMDELTNWVKLPTTTTLFNEETIRQAAHAIWDKYCQGTVPKWEMDSLSFYYTEHELAHVNMNEYALSNFSEIPETPVKVGESVRSVKDKTTGETKQTTWDKYQLYRIAGTVLDKNKTKHSITLLTTDGVVNVKFYAGAFSHYDKQISKVSPDGGKKTVLEKSWFTRGNKLLITGIRRGDTFMPKKYYDSIYQHTVCRIDDVYSNGSMTMTYERTEA